MTRRRAGRHVLPSTLFLIHSLWQGCDPRQLYPDWRALHRYHSGYELAAPRRSYRAALKVAKLRIERMRK